ncbi:proline dehydrogenase family protein [Effusibacillus dendaii]|uniref:Proline dehydrogenase domain-containing protein n=1 Tax=Effusibacillus dendaii TaxID=2743772 RepID=A0A7I8D946_9BACL|nr:proline dehydrogenase family protein [Effusibacillus dendaii]BCJ86644.1 hypothetical protein skT53_16290 [Effusibacillus dendaii]
MESILRNLLIFLSKNRLAKRLAEKFGLRLGADRFVAGLTIETAIEAALRLNRSGIEATLDHLGEFVQTEREVIQSAKSCIATMEAIKSAGVQSYLSVKLTQLGLDVDPILCERLMHRILQCAQELNVFVRIDMEDYAHNQATIDLFKQLLMKYGETIGLVLQAYLYKTLTDLSGLTPFSPNIRFVKGAYKESKSVAFANKSDVDRNLVNLIETYLANGNYAAIGRTPGQPCICSKIAVSQVIPLRFDGSTICLISVSTIRGGDFDDRVSQ